MNITNIIDKHEPVAHILPSQLYLLEIARENPMVMKMEDAFSHPFNHGNEKSEPLYTRATVEKMLGEVQQWLPIETAQKPSQTLVMRTGDMCQVSRLMVVIDGEGDVGVRTTGKNMVEFCTAQGGGRSPRTREALLALMVAIEADAAEREQLTSITHVETSIYAAPSPAKEQG